MSERAAPTLRLLSPRQLADVLGVPVATVYAWNTRDDGPRKIRVGKHVRYRLSDVDKWLDERTDGGGRTA